MESTDSSEKRRRMPVLQPIQQRVMGLTPRPRMRYFRTPSSSRAATTASSGSPYNSILPLPEFTPRDRRKNPNFYRRERRRKGTRKTKKKPKRASPSSSFISPYFPENMLTDADYFSDGSDDINYILANRSSSRSIRPRSPSRSPSMSRKRSRGSRTMRSPSRSRRRLRGSRSRIVKRR